MLVIFDSQAFQERYQIGSIFYTKKPQKIIQVVVEVTPKWLGGTDGVIQLFNLMSDAGLIGYELFPDGKVGSIVKPADIKKQVDVLFLRSIPAQF